MAVVHRSRAAHRLATKKPSAVCGTRQKPRLEPGRCSRDRRLTFPPGKTTCTARARSCSTWPDPNLRARSQVVPRPPKGSASVGGPRPFPSARRQTPAQQCAPWSGQATRPVRSAPMLAPPAKIEMPWRRAARAVREPLVLAACARRGARPSGSPPSSPSGGGSQGAEEDPAASHAEIGVSLAPCPRTGRSVGPLASCTARPLAASGVHAAAHRLRLSQASTADPSTASEPFSEALEVPYASCPCTLAPAVEPAPVTSRVEPNAVGRSYRAFRDRVRRWAELGPAIVSPTPLPMAILPLFPPRHPHPPLPPPPPRARAVRALP